LPCGAGCTGAIEKTTRILQNLPKMNKTSIFLTPYEHHSNILPWVEFYEKVSVLPHNEHGDLLMDEI
jgi:selenocysteine lyase/cysteine desulfurase